MVHGALLMGEMWTLGGRVDIVVRRSLGLEEGGELVVHALRKFGKGFLDELVDLGGEEIGSPWRVEMLVVW
jgi:hypothetical protein